ncbi:unnamed protein product [Symbiodinium microadriaticum]|nr:unnamed protein product [Symbiodinium microadriaticum]
MLSGPSLRELPNSSMADSKVAWWVQSVPVYKRRYCGAQLLGRNQAETIGNFLVRETLVHEEFVEAIIRLYEEKEGVAQDQRDFGLPPGEDEEWGDNEWNGSWGWWNYDEDYDYDGDGDAPPREGPEAPDGPDPGEPEAGDDGASPHTGAGPGSSPSHKSVPEDFPSRSPSRRATPASPQPEVVKPAVTEMSVTDSFIMGVLRGWRLLQASGLSAEEKRDILSATKNSLDYEVVSAALQNLWDDQLLGHRAPQHSMHANMMESQSDPSSFHHYDGYYQEQDDWWWQDQGWHDHYFLGDHSWEDSEYWSGSWEPDALPAVTDATDDDDPKLKEAQKAEAIAESLAVEAQRTWTEAQRAIQALRKDRGFGGPTKCFNCGGNHMVRDCPQRRSTGFFKGKSFGGKGGYSMEADAYYHEPWDLNYNHKGKGKSKGKKGHAAEMQLQAMWKGKNKGKSNKGKDSVYRPVNAYATDMFVGGLELTDVFEAASSELKRKPDMSPQVGMLDSGATASAAPDAVVQGLISTVLSHDRNAKIELDQGLMVDFASGCVDPEVEQILVASLKAKAATAKSKAKPLDRSRVMNMDVRIRAPR